MDSWVNMLRSDYDYSLMQVKNVPVEYYENIFSKIMQESGHALNKDTKAWDIVSLGMKQFGKDFSEEKIEWMAMQAIHKSGRLTHLLRKL